MMTIVSKIYIIAKIRRRLYLKYEFFLLPITLVGAKVF